jgi:MEDS: MEthanogen/methylotroph, DcmR Sensory domain
MRNHGSRFGLMRMGPHDHIGWIFSGPGEFAGLAEPFLAEGAARNEMLMYVTDEPDISGFGQWTETLAPGMLTVATVADVYGASGVVDAAKQRATFAQALGGALVAGHRGIRVAADNTPLVLTEERVEAWMRWEIVADHFMSQHPVTGLCAFDKTRTDVSTLSHLATLHPVWPANSDQPPYRLFSNDSALWLEGEVNSFALGQAKLALESLPPKTNVVVDLTKTQVVTNDALSALRQLCETGVGVTVRGATEIVRRLAQSTGIPAQNLSWADPQQA